MLLKKKKVAPAKELKQTNKKMKTKITDLEQKNKTLQEQLETNTNLQEALESLMTANKHFRDQHDTDKSHIDELEKRIVQLSSSNNAASAASLSSPVIGANAANNSHTGRGVGGDLWEEVIEAMEDERSQIGEQLRKMVEGEVEKRVGDVKHEVEGKVGGEVAEWKKEERRKMEEREKEREEKYKKDLIESLKEREEEEKKRMEEMEEKVKEERKKREEDKEERNKERETEKKEAERKWKEREEQWREEDKDKRAREKREREEEEKRQKEREEDNDRTSKEKREREEKEKREEKERRKVKKEKEREEENQRSRKESEEWKEKIESEVEERERVKMGRKIGEERLKWEEEERKKRDDEREERDRKGAEASQGEEEEIFGVMERIASQLDEKEAETIREREEKEKWKGMYWTLKEELEKREENEEADKKSRENEKRERREKEEKERKEKEDRKRREREEREERDRQEREKRDARDEARTKEIEQLKDKTRRETDEMKEQFQTELEQLKHKEAAEQQQRQQREDLEAKQREEESQRRQKEKNKRRQDKEKSEQEKQQSEAQEQQRREEAAAKLESDNQSQQTQLKSQIESVLEREKKLQSDNEVLQNEVTTLRSSLESATAAVAASVVAAASSAPEVAASPISNRLRDRSMSLITPPKPSLSNSNSTGANANTNATPDTPATPGVSPSPVDIFQRIAQRSNYTKGSPGSGLRSVSSSADLMSEMEKVSPGAAGEITNHTETTDTNRKLPGFARRRSTTTIIPRQGSNSNISGDEDDIKQEDILVNALQLEGLLNKLSISVMKLVNQEESKKLGAMVTKQTKNYLTRLNKYLDQSSRRISEGGAPAIGLNDPLRRTQIEEGISQLESLYPLTENCVALVYSKPISVINQNKFRGFISKMSEANHQIATSSTLAFVDESIEGEVGEGSKGEEEIKEEVAVLIEDSTPNIMVAAKAALASPSDEGARNRLTNLIKETREISQSVKNKVPKIPITSINAGGNVRRELKFDEIKGSDDVDGEYEESLLGSRSDNNNNNNNNRHYDLDEEQRMIDGNTKLEDDEKAMIKMLQSQETETLRQGIEQITHKLESINENERRYVRIIMGLREKLNDANLAVMNKTMRSVLSFKKLTQLSNACIDNVLRESKNMYKLPGLKNPSLMCVCIDMVMEVAILMRRNNDFSEGINAPTLEKLERFTAAYESRRLAGAAGRGIGASAGAQAGTQAGNQAAKEGGLLSWMFGSSRSPSGKDQKGGGGGGFLSPRGK